MSDHLVSDDQPRKRALVVDNDEISARVLSITLTQIGWQVETAYCGRDAVDWSTLRKFDLILLEWYLPDMSGEEVVKSIRQASVVSRDSRIAAVTEFDDKKLCLDCGANHYLQKPVNIQAIREIAGVVKT